MWESKPLEWFTYEEYTDWLYTTCVSSPCIYDSGASANGMETWLWIVLFILLGLCIGGVVCFMMQRSKQTNNEYTQIVKDD